MMSIAFPPGCSSEFIDELLDGLFELADANRVSIVGGDTSSSRDSLFIDLSVIGDCQSGKAVTRRGATAGDRIYVSGSLGASALGLSLLEAGFRLHETQDDRDLKTQAVLKHLRPEPQLRLGQAVSEQSLATSMIDISDGLSTDLSHILEESGVGAIIYSSALPIAGCVRSLAPHDSRVDPTTFALHGGEEYELLFTASHQNHQRVLALAETTDAPITLIGEIVAQKEVGLERNGRIEPLKPLGYQHHI
jgi:thiamine-monophosphate kinase